jgi:predicted Na+-dependent transporter
MERRTGSMTTYLDRASVIVIILTFALFVSALVVKGLTHDLFLEAGVLLVSVKLILNGYHMNAHTERLEGRIDEILGLLEQLVGPSRPAGRQREHAPPSPDPSP